MPFNYNIMNMANPLPPNKLTHPLKPPTTHAHLGEGFWYNMWKKLLARRKGQVKWILMGTKNLQSYIRPFPLEQTLAHDLKMNIHILMLDEIFEDDHKGPTQFEFPLGNTREGNITIFGDNILIYVNFMYICNFHTLWICKILIICYIDATGAVFVVCLVITCR